MFVCTQEGVFVQGGLCPGSLCPGGVSVQVGSLSGGLYPGGLCPGSLCQEGSLSRGVSVRETPLYSYVQAVHILLECILVYLIGILWWHKIELQKILEFYFSVYFRQLYIFSWVVCHYCLQWKPLRWEEPYPPLASKIWWQSRDHWWPVQTYSLEDPRPHGIDIWWRGHQSMYGLQLAICVILKCFLVTARKWSCRKVMFLQTSVNLFTGGEE